MGIQVVTASGNGIALSNSVIARYLEEYKNGIMPERLYDQISVPVARNMEEVSRGSVVYWPYLSDMTPGTTAISEVTDLTPQTLLDATGSITPTSRAEALQCSEKLWVQGFTDYHAQMAQRVGKGMMETLEVLARDAATQGSFVIRAAARSSLDAGTSTHNASDATFMEASGYLQQFKIPGFKDAKNGTSNWAAITHPFVFHDILLNGNVVAIAQYQNQSIIFNHELGSLSGFRLIVSPWAKVFYGAGVNNAKACDTVTAAAISALDTTFTISNTSSVDIGEFLNVGTEETANTHYATNERVRWVSDASKVVTIIGEGVNGGFRFDHASGTTVNNSDSVYTIIFGGPDSLVKVYSPSIGEYGQIVGPKRDGKVDQFISLGFKFYGGYGRLRENGLIRQEVTVDMES